MFDKEKLDDIRQARQAWETRQAKAFPKTAIFRRLGELALSTPKSAALHQETVVPDRLLAESAWNLWEEFPANAPSVISELKEMSMYAARPPPAPALTAPTFESIESTRVAGTPRPRATDTQSISGWVRKSCPPEST